MKILTIPSNLYAERIYAEHPSALWALDDSIDYISLLDEADRDFSNSSKWDITNGTAISITADPSGYLEQFPNSFLTNVSGTTPTGSSQTTTLVGKTQLSSGGDSFSIGAHFYLNSIYITKIEIGYKDANNQIHLSSRDFTTEYHDWYFVSGMFEYTGNFYPVIKITYSKSQASDDYDVLINGLAIGSNAEEYLNSSLGIPRALKVDMPSAIGVNVYGISADAYGIGGDSGYYLLGSDNVVKARNAGVPMVFGAYNATTLYPFPNRPSLLIPGKGFLNKKGASSTYAFEAWLKVNTSGVNSFSRIVGPVNSTDGLYVNKQFLILVIGNKTISHYVGEWSRPMLIQINYSETYANLILNGEVIGSTLIEASDREAFVDNDPDLDWIGFYVPENISNIQVDCVAIYPYIISDVIAKRRFVYGQAVEYPSILNTAFGGQSTLIDHSVANFAKTYSYPDIGNWKQGISENLTINTKTVAIPSYDIPDFISASGDTSELLLSMQDSQPGIKVSSLDSESDLYQKSGYFRVNNLSITPSPVTGVYARFILDEIPTQRQTLFEIRNSSTNDAISCWTDGTYVKLDFFYQGNTTALSSSTIQEGSDSLTVFLSFDEMISHFGANLSNFLSNKTQLQAFICGSPIEQNETFVGRLDIFGLCCSINQKIILESMTFDSSSNGVSWALDKNQSITPPSYGFFKNIVPGVVTIFDIKAHAYWEDYLPLSYFQKPVKDSSGNDYRTVDFLQFNLDSENTFSFDEFNKYDQSSWNARTTVSFIDTTTTARTDASTISKMDKNGVVKYSAGWEDVEQEIVNSAIVYPPAVEDQSVLGLVVKTYFVSNGITLEPIKSRSLQIVSQSLNDILPNSFGTKFGVSVYPYIEGENDSVDYKSENPFVVSKVTAPHLYLGKQTGAMSVGDYDLNIDRGLMVLVNQDASPDFSLSAMQICLKSSLDAFPDGQTNIIEIHTKSYTVDIQVEPINANNSRAKISAYINGVQDKTIKFYVNGVMAETPIISIDEWLMLGMAFTVPLEFTSFTGKVKFGGPTVVNNLSYYQVSDSQKLMSLIENDWGYILYDLVLDQTRDWASWTSDTWQTAYVKLTPTLVGINPTEIYNIYVGSNRQVFDSTGSKTLTFNKYEYTAYKDLRWQSKVVPVV